MWAAKYAAGAGDHPGDEKWRDRGERMEPKARDEREGAKRGDRDDEREKASEGRGAMKWAGGAREGD